LFHDRLLRRRLFIVVIILTSVKHVLTAYRTGSFAVATQPVTHAITGNRAVSSETAGLSPEGIKQPAALPVGWLAVGAFIAPFFDALFIL
jgi:hypothetical protein